MSKIYVSHFHGFNDLEATKMAVSGIEAESEKELRLKLRGRLLANLDSIVEELMEKTFSLQYVTPLGQRVYPEVYEMMQSLPKGYTLIEYTYQVRPGCIDYRTMYYQAPEGIEVDGKTLRESEFYRAGGYYGSNPPWAVNCTRL